METALTETPVAAPDESVSVNREGAIDVLAPVTERGSENEILRRWYPLSYAADEDTTYGVPEPPLPELVAMLVTIATPLAISAVAEFSRTPKLSFVIE
jgi:hypothetical protein